MSGRCKACNVILDEFEMTRKWPSAENTNDYCDLCTHCLKASEDDYEPLMFVDDDFDEDFDLEDL